jgi:hypothetical protein
VKWQVQIQGTAALAVAVALAVAGLGVHPGHAWAGPPPGDTITPDSAEVPRAAARMQSRQATDGEASGDVLAARGRELQDPRLLADAAAAFLEHARRTRELSALDRAEAEGALALDMLGFLASGKAASAWQPIDPSRLDAEIADVESLLRDARALRDEIDAEQAAAAAPPPPPPEKRRKLRPGTGLIAGGAGALALGLGGVGLGAAGLAMGQSAQRDIDDPNVYGDAWRDADERGDLGNDLAVAGFVVAGVGLAAGTTLVALGVKKRRRAEGARERAQVAVTPTMRGFVLTGRF